MTKQQFKKQCHSQFDSPQQIHNGYAVIFEGKFWEDLKWIIRKSIEIICVWPSPTQQQAAVVAMKIVSTTTTTRHFCNCDISIQWRLDRSHLSFGDQSSKLGRQQKPWEVEHLPCLHSQESLPHQSRCWQLRSFVTWDLNVSNMSCSVFFFSWSKIMTVSLMMLVLQNWL